MLHAIEQETVISIDGKLPEAFRPAFGHKARVIVLMSESEEFPSAEKGQSEKLMEFAGTIDWPITDAVEWQRQQRSDWDREWDR